LNEFSEAWQTCPHEVGFRLATDSGVLSVLQGKKKDNAFNHTYVEYYLKIK
jgi:hypothetical protein